MLIRRPQIAPPVARPLSPRPAAPRRGRGGARRGAAIVEFAVVAPVLFLVIFGIIEFGRAMMVLQILNGAAREGCRQGTLEGVSESAVKATVRSRLTAESVPGADATVRVLVNGVEADPASASKGDSVRVEVTIPYERVSYVPAPWFLGGAELGAAVVMRHE
ncbi:MAG TPA: TadE/TadG family type IV pilus assembly protein [Gemmataceae bacterium]